MGRSLAGALEADGGAGLSEETRQRLLAALVRSYARDWLARRGDVPPPFPDGAVPTEEVAVVAAQMLRAADVTTFELAALFDV